MFLYHVDYSTLNGKSIVLKLLQTSLDIFLKKPLWESKYVAVKDVESASHQKRTLSLIYGKQRDMIFKLRKNREKCRYDKLRV